VSLLTPHRPEVSDDSRRTSGSAAATHAILGSSHYGWGLAKTCATRWTTRARSSFEPMAQFAINISLSYRTAHLLKYVSCAAASLLLTGCATDHHAPIVRSNVVPSYWLQDADSAKSAGPPSSGDGVHNRHPSPDFPDGRQHSYSCTNRQNLP
jgi:hypothetical protein